MPKFAAKQKNNRGKHIAKTGPLPGVTRSVVRLKVSEDPLVYLMDTPGVMMPKILNQEQGFNLALAGAIRQDLVGVDHLADYLFYCLNKQVCQQ